MLDQCLIRIAAASGSMLSRIFSAESSAVHFKVIALDADGTCRDVSADVASAIVTGAASAGEALTDGGITRTFWSDTRQHQW
jgi:hypothetical protein